MIMLSCKRNYARTMSVDFQCAVHKQANSLAKVALRKESVDG